MRCRLDVVEGAACCLKELGTGAQELGVAKTLL